ncbi:hypothetical protein [Methylobacterium sp. A54F]
MKRQALAYTFAPGARQVTLLGLPGLAAAQVLAIVNTTANAPLYLAGDPDLGLAAYAAGTLTLKADTAAMAPTDALLILYEDGAQDTLVPPGSPFSASAAGTLAALRTDGYGTVALSVAAVAAGSLLAFEVSTDSSDGQDGTWAARLMQPPGGGPAAAFTMAPGLFAASVPERWFRVRQAVYGGAGASSVGIVLRRAALAPQTLACLPSGAGLPCGTTATRIKVAAGLNPTLVKAGPANLYGLVVSSAASAARFLKLYNRASPPAVGTDAPQHTILVPAGQTVSLQFPVPQPFTAGLAYATTLAAADTNTAGITADDLNGVLNWA